MHEMDVRLALAPGRISGDENVGRHVEELEIGA
jgi:hypothetical protein